MTTLNNDPLPVTNHLEEVADVLQSAELPMATTAEDLPLPTTTVPTATPSSAFTTNEAFESMGLREEILLGLYGYGFHKPSTIQKRMMEPFLKGRDLVAQAASGSGKTTAFAITSLQVVKPDVRSIQVVILSPTRELAQQTCTLISALGAEMGISAHACVGGLSQKEDIRRLQQGIHIVSGTPGRLFEMIRLRHLETRDVKLFILDEADELLGKGFKEKLHDIYRMLPQTMQIVLVSATLPRTVVEMTEQFMTDPVKILVKRDELSVEDIQHYVVNLPVEDWKIDTLFDLYESLEIGQALIFCNTRERVEWLAGKMRTQKFPVVFMHGEVPQVDRDQVMRQFRDGHSRVLITTDLWARGIDVQQVSLIINYDVPLSREQYIHRVGRSGRYGRQGTAITFCKPRELKMIQDIEAFYAIDIQEMPVNVEGL